MKQGFEITPHSQAERAYLIGVSLPNSSIAREHEHLDELEQLARTAGADVVGKAIQGRTRVDGATYIGEGKAREIKEACDRTGANLVIFDNDLSPAQARNLENILDLNIIDRTELILDIFARHAKTQAAKIQVELAQLQYALPRLVRMWKHLERQAGGIGTRGPGETQLEVDRRRIHQRMGSLRRQLKKLSQRKQTIRDSRRETRVVALIGYTNAGKSTLMQRLTGADVFVEDRLFATLDTTTRRIQNGKNGANGNGAGGNGAHSRNDSILLIDTVGFIRKLPHHLVTSFKATLEDIAQAELYLHVVDGSQPAYEEHMEVTDNTVREIANPGVGKVYVFNKIDRLSNDQLEGLKSRYPDGVFVSAKDNYGMDQVWSAIDLYFFGKNVKVEVKIPAGDGRTIARIRSMLRDPSGTFEEDMCVLLGTIESDQMGRLESVAGAEIRYLF
ncbi:MAG: GTPase HflX [Candidatus Latescibacterota bacterium]